MRKFLMGIILASFVLVLLAACGGGNDTPSDADQEVDENTETSTEGSNDEDKLKVVSSFTIITDMVREVAGTK